MYEYRAQILDVIDGETLFVRIDLGFSIFHDAVIRLFGVDMTSLDDLEKELKKSWLKARLLSQQTGMLICTMEDTSGRFKAIIWEEGCDLPSSVRPPSLNDRILEMARV